MITVTFAQGVNNVAVTGSIGFNTDFIPKALNHPSIKTADGNELSYWGGVKEFVGNLEIKGVSYTDGEALRSWLINYVRFKTNTFSISAILNTNLGRGKNVYIPTARYTKDDLEGVFSYQPPGIFNINLPYRFVSSSAYP